MSKNTFNPPKINYLALMMVDNQVHYHVLPRYEGVVKINNTEYKDHCWPVAHDLKPLERSEEHTSELQSRPHLVCRLLLEKKKKKTNRKDEKKTEIKWIDILKDMALRQAAT